MSQVYGFDDSDVDRIRTMLRAFESGRFNVPLGSNTPYRSPPIETRVGITTSDITPVDELQPGCGTVALVNLEEGNGCPSGSGTGGSGSGSGLPALTDEGDDVTVWSIHPYVISEGIFVLLIRDPYSGQFFVMPEDDPRNSLIRVVPQGATEPAVSFYTDTLSFNDQQSFSVDETLDGEAFISINDASATTTGVVNLADGQVLGDGDKVVQGTVTSSVEGDSGNVVDHFIGFSDLTSTHIVKVSTGDYTVCDPPYTIGVTGSHFSDELLLRPLGGKAIFTASASDGLPGSRHSFTFGTSDGTRPDLTVLTGLCTGATGVTETICINATDGQHVLVFTSGLLTRWSGPSSCSDSGTGSGSTGTGTGSGSGTPCSSCSGSTPSTWTVIASGFVGVCEEWNGTWTLTQDGSDPCFWTGGPPDTINLRIDSGLVTVGFTGGDVTSYSTSFIDCCSPHTLDLSECFCDSCPSTVIAMPSCMSVCGCAGVPAELTVTITNVSGGCSCMAGSYTVTFAGGATWSHTGISVCSGNTMSLALVCVGGDLWELSIVCAEDTTTMTQAADSCNPLLISYGTQTWDHSGGTHCCAGGSASFTVTE